MLCNTVYADERDRFKEYSNFLPVQCTRHMSAILTRDAIYLAAIYIKVSFVPFLSQCRMKEKTLIVLWRAKVPHSTIRSQLKISKSP
jgi:hypothetical protein